MKKRKEKPLGLTQFRDTIDDINELLVSNRVEDANSQIKALVDDWLATSNSPWRGDVGDAKYLALSQLKARNIKREEIMGAFANFG